MSNTNTSSSSIVISEVDTHDGNLNNNNNDILNQLQVHPSMIASMTIHVQVMRGRDLVAKDGNTTRRLLNGFKKDSTETAMTSDPYVKVLYQDQPYGKTRTISNNCVDPVWDDTIVIALTANQARECVQHVFGTDSHLKDGLPTIDCMVYDHDRLTFDDCMGIVQVPLTRDYFLCHNNNSNNYLHHRSDPQWYPVVNQQRIMDLNTMKKTKATTNEVCHSATGDLYIRIHVEQQSMLDLNTTTSRCAQLPTTAKQQKQQQKTLDDTKNDTTTKSVSLSTTSTSGHYDIEIAWEAPVTVADDRYGRVKYQWTAIDTACVAMDQTDTKNHGNINFNTNDSVHSNTYCNPNQSIVRKTNGDDGNTIDIQNTNGLVVTNTMTRSATYQVKLRSIPNHIPVLVLCAFVAGNPVTTNQWFTESILSSMTLRVIHSDTNIGVCAYRFIDCMNRSTFNDDNPNGNQPTALIVAQLTRESIPNEKYDAWTIQPVPQLQEQQPGSSGVVFITNEKGRDFGTISPEIKECVYHNNIRKSRTILPNMTLNPQEPRTAMIRTNGTICINDYVTNEHISSEQGLVFACQWTDPLPALHRTLKHSFIALLLDEQYDCLEAITDHHRQSNFNDGCVRMGNKQHRSEENMNVLLSGDRIPTDVKYIVFVLETNFVIYTAPPEKKQYTQLYFPVSFNVRNPITNQTIALYRQRRPTVIPTEYNNRSAVVLGCVYRKKNINSSSSTSNIKNTIGNEWQYHLFDERLSSISSLQQSTDMVRKVVQDRDSILHCSAATAATAAATTAATTATTTAATTTTTITTTTTTTTTTGTATTESVIPVPTTTAPTSTTVVDDSEETDIVL